MPTYGYECLSCQNQFEIMQSIKDDALTVCDICGGTLRKRVYPVGIAFKGSGFYVNDYAPKSASSSSESAASEPAKSESTSSPSSETPKAETKSEPAKTEVKSETKSETKTGANTST